VRRWGVLATALLLVLAAACSRVGPGPSGVEPRKPELRVVALNQLHGIFCPAETDQCEAPSRLHLLFRDLEEARCPQIVGLAEISARQAELVPKLLPSVCGGRYELLYEPGDGSAVLDEEMVLTTLPVRDHDFVDLASFPWSGHWAKLDTPIGVVDFVVVHQASSSNNPPCSATNCPPICVVGEETGTCQTRQLIAFMDAHATPGGIQIVSGDLNRPSSDPRITPYFDAGFVDAWTEAGTRECDPRTGENCTCCIHSQVESYDGGGLKDPTLQRDERIDFVLARNTTTCELKFGHGTRIFAGPPAAEPVNGVYWPSDHAGVLAELSLHGSCVARRST
jgi:hypothetical protein